jgi:3-hydroxyisobutyrate dehydrogenase-like beta-hydroxyacid dehydrogenase
LRVTIAEADAAAQLLAVIAAANDLYVRARQQGHGDADFSEVLEAVKKGQQQQ